MFVIVNFKNSKSEFSIKQPYLFFCLMPVKAAVSIDNVFPTIVYGVPPETLRSYVITEQLRREKPFKTSIKLPDTQDYQMISHHMRERHNAFNCRSAETPGINIPRPPETTSIDVGIFNLQLAAIIHRGACRFL